MADEYNKGILTRPQWAGANSDVDIHIEAYEGDIDGSFRVESMFRSSGLTNFKSVQNQSNTWRGDRIGGVQVKGRKSGETLDGARVATDKFIITVDTTSYIRTNVDYQDDWTAPDFQAEYSAEHGTAHAKVFDQAHIIQLIKCGAFVAPAHLKVPGGGGFYDGISIAMTGYEGAVARDGLTAAESKADVLVAYHKKAVTELIKRDLGGDLTSYVTLTDPDTFSVLLDNKKLTSVDWQGGSGENNFAQRRIGYVNGLKVIETPRFPTAAIATHVLGAGFTLSAAEAKARMVLFAPKKALVTVEAMGMTVRHWDDPLNFQSVLDSYTMYTVGQKRPDSVAVLFSAT